MKVSFVSDRHKRAFLSIQRWNHPKEKFRNQDCVSEQAKQIILAEIFDFSLNFQGEFGVYNINDRSDKGRILEMDLFGNNSLED
jgi:hypothetical protein